MTTLVLFKWTVHESRQYLFSWKGCSIDKCPLTIDARVQHAKRDVKRNDPKPYMDKFYVVELATIQP